MKKLVKPEVCPICPNKDTEKITNVLKGNEYPAWFCLSCGSLIGWIK